MTAGIIMLPPLEVTSSMLATNLVDETLPAYSASTTYASGARVIVPETHMIFESAISSNLGNNPTTSTDAQWLVVGKTNQYRMWDARTSSKSGRTGGFYATVTPGQVVNSVYMERVTADSVRIRVTDPTAGTVYDKTVDMSALPMSADHYSWFYGVREAQDSLLLLDLPAYPAASIRIDVNGADVSVGNCVLSQALVYGAGVEWGFEISNQDYSLIDTNKWGDTLLRPGETTRNQTFTTILRKYEVDVVRRRLNSFAGKAVVYISWEDVMTAAVFGYCAEFTIRPTDALEAQLSTTIKGLT